MYTFGFVMYKRFQEERQDSVRQPCLVAECGEFRLGHVIRSSAHIPPAYELWRLNNSPRDCPADWRGVESIIQTLPNCVVESRRCGEDSYPVCCEYLL